MFAAAGSGPPGVLAGTKAEAKSSSPTELWQRRVAAVVLLFPGGFSPNLLSDLPGMSCARGGGGAQDFFWGQEKRESTSFSSDCFLVVLFLWLS